MAVSNKQMSFGSAVVDCADSGVAVIMVSDAAVKSADNRRQRLVDQLSLVDN